MKKWTHIGQKEEEKKAYGTCCKERGYGTFFQKYWSSVLYACLFEFYVKTRQEFCRSQEENI